MNDIDGNEVVVGDLVRILSIEKGFLDCLDVDSRRHHLAMMGKDFCIDEIVDEGTKASVSLQWECVEGIATGGLFMLPNEFRLITRG